MTRKFLNIEPLQIPDSLSEDAFQKDKEGLDALKQDCLRLRGELEERIHQLNSAIEMVESLGGALEAAELREAFFGIPIPD